VVDNADKEVYYPLSLMSGFHLFDLRHC